MNNRTEGKAPLKHVHAMEDVTGLNDALANKSNIDHVHSTSELTDLNNIKVKLKIYTE